MIQIHVSNSPRHSCPKYSIAPLAYVTGHASDADAVHWRAPQLNTAELRAAIAVATSECVRRASYPKDLILLAASQTKKSTSARYAYLSTLPSNVEFVENNARAKENFYLP